MKTGLREAHYKAGDIDITMPIMPESCKMMSERNVSAVNIHAAGEITIAGERLAARWDENYLLPSRYKSGMMATEKDPEEIVKQFLAWQDSKTVVTYSVKNTLISKECLIEKVECGESGGFNDYSLTLSLVEYRMTGAVSSVLKDVEKTITKKVKKGDTLGKYAKAYYGDSTLKDKLLKYNKLKSYSAVKVGKKIKIPPRKKLK